MAGAWILGFAHPPIPPRATDVGGASQPNARRRVNRYGMDMPLEHTTRLRAARTGIAAAAAAGLALVAGCSAQDAAPSPTVTSVKTHTPAPVVVTATPSPEPDQTSDNADANPYARPLWLGATPLALDTKTELGTRAGTPADLRDRQLEPRAFLPFPTTDEWVADFAPVPADVAERSTWASNCPVALEDLSYITMPYWGFDQQVHQGEMLIHRDVAADVVSAFEKIYAAQFPIEEMRVMSLSDRDSPATGDQNVTSGFACRTIVGTSTLWSEHSKGFAIDINPFHNPYIRGDALFPELAEAYLDRNNARPGMIGKPGAVYDAFEAIGWGWGGNWATHDDWMHFSSTGG